MFLAHILINSCETSEVFFNGAAEADGDDEASFRLFGGRAEGFCCKYFLYCFRDEARHFQVAVARVCESRASQGFED